MIAHRHPSVGLSLILALQLIAVVSTATTTTTTATTTSATTTTTVATTTTPNPTTTFSATDAGSCWAGQLYSTFGYWDGSSYERSMTLVFNDWAPNTAIYYVDYPIENTWVRIQAHRFGINEYAVAKPVLCLSEPLPLIARLFYYCPTYGLNYLTQLYTTIPTNTTVCQTSSGGVVTLSMLDNSLNFLRVYGAGFDTNGDYTVQFEQEAGGIPAVATPITVNSGVMVVPLPNLCPTYLANTTASLFKIKVIANHLGSQVLPKSDGSGPYSGRISPGNLMSCFNGEGSISSIVLSMTSINITGSFNLAAYDYVVKVSNLMHYQFSPYFEFTPEIINSGHISLANPACAVASPLSSWYSMSVSVRAIPKSGVRSDSSSDEESNQRRLLQFSETNTTTSQLETTTQTTTTTGAATTTWSQPTTAAQLLLKSQFDSNYWNSALYGYQVQMILDFNACPVDPSFPGQVTMNGLVVYHREISFDILRSNVASFRYFVEYVSVDQPGIASGTQATNATGQGFNAPAPPVPCSTDMNIYFNYNATVYAISLTDPHLTRIPLLNFPSLMAFPGDNSRCRAGPAGAISSYRFSRFDASASDINLIGGVFNNMFNYMITLTARGNGVAVTTTVFNATSGRLGAEFPDVCMAANGNPNRIFDVTVVAVCKPGTASMGCVDAGSLFWNRLDDGIPDVVFSVPYTPPNLASCERPEGAIASIQSNMQWVNVTGYNFNSGYNYYIRFSRYWGSFMDSLDVAATMVSSHSLTAASPVCTPGSAIATWYYPQVSVVAVRAGGAGLREAPSSPTLRRLLQISTTPGQQQQTTWAPGAQPETTTSTTATTVTTATTTAGSTTTPTGPIFLQSTSTALNQWNSMYFGYQQGYPLDFNQCPNCLSPGYVYYSQSSGSYVQFHVSIPSTRYTYALRLSIGGLSPIIVQVYNSPSSNVFQAMFANPTVCTSDPRVEFDMEAIATCNSDSSGPIVLTRFNNYAVDNNLPSCAPNVPAYGYLSLLGLDHNDLIIYGVGLNPAYAYTVEFSFGGISAATVMSNGRLEAPVPDLCLVANGNPNAEFSIRVWATQGPNSYAVHDAYAPEASAPNQGVFVKRFIPPNLQSCQNPAGTVAFASFDGLELNITGHGFDAQRRYAVRFTSSPFDYAVYNFATQVDAVFVNSGLLRVANPLCGYRVGATETFKITVVVVDPASSQTTQWWSGYTTQWWNAQTSQPGWNAQTSQPGWNAQTSQPGWNAQTSQPGWNAQTSQPWGATTPAGAQGTTAGLRRNVHLRDQTGPGTTTTTATAGTTGVPRTFSPGQNFYIDGTDSDASGMVYNGMFNINNVSLVINVHNGTHSYPVYNFVVTPTQLFVPLPEGVCRAPGYGTWTVSIIEPPNHSVSFNHQFSSSSFANCGNTTAYTGSPGATAAAWTSAPGATTAPRSFSAGENFFIDTSGTNPSGITYSGMFNLNVTYTITFGAQAYPVNNFVMNPTELFVPMPEAVCNATGFAWWNMYIVEPSGHYVNFVHWIHPRDFAVCASYTYTTTPANSWGTTTAAGNGWTQSTFPQYTSPASNGGSSPGTGTALPSELYTNEIFSEFIDFDITQCDNCLNPGYDRGWAQLGDSYGYRLANYNPNHFDYFVVFNIPSVGYTSPRLPAVYSAALSNGTTTSAVIAELSYCGEVPNGAVMEIWGSVLCRSSGTIISQSWGSVVLYTPPAICSKPKLDVTFPSYILSSNIVSGNLTLTPPPSGRLEVTVDLSGPAAATTGISPRTFVLNSNNSTLDHVFEFFVQTGGRLGMLYLDFHITGPGADAFANTTRVEAAVYRNGPAIRRGCCQNP